MSPFDGTFCGENFINEKFRGVKMGLGVVGQKSIFDVSEIIGTFVTEVGFITILSMDFWDISFKLSTHAWLQTEGGTCMPPVIALRHQL